MPKYRIDIRIDASVYVEADDAYDAQELVHECTVDDLIESDMFTALTFEVVDAEETDITPSGGRKLLKREDDEEYDE